MTETACGFRCLGTQAVALICVRYPWLTSNAMKQGRRHKSVTMRFLHRLFALFILLSFSDLGANLRRELQVGKSHKWHGVKHIHPSLTGYDCVSIGSGTNKADIDQARD